MVSFHRRLVKGRSVAACALLAVLGQGAAAAQTVGSNPLDTVAAPNETVDLSLALESGNYINYLHRTSLGSHTLLLTSPQASANGTQARFLYATSADNSDAVAFFSDGVNATNTSNPLSITLVNDSLRTAVGPSELIGISGNLSLSKNATLDLSIVGSVRAVRDYVEGGGLMNPLFNYTVTQLDASVVWLSRPWLNESTVTLANGTTVTKRFGMELRFEAINGTSFQVAQGVPNANGTLSQPTVRIVAPTTGDNATLAFTIATNATQFGILPAADLFRAPTTNESENAAREQMRFLTHSEKFMAGSWRFLTYFGRDTLFTLKLLTANRVLSAKAVESVLSAALDRVNLTDGRVAHEETLGDYATFVNQQNGHPELGNSVFLDYKMQDTNFLLVPQLAAYLLDYNGTASLTMMDNGTVPANMTGPGAPTNVNMSPLPLPTGAGNDTAPLPPQGNGTSPLANSTSSPLSPALAFLNRTSTLSNTTTYSALLESNIAYILNLTAPFLANATYQNLIANEAGIPVGNWRDSNAGLGYGNIAYDVNAAHVPAALYAIADLADAGLVLGGNATLANSTRAAAQFWETRAPEFFKVSLNVSEQRARVYDFVNRTGLDESLLYGKGLLNGTAGEGITISLNDTDSAGTPSPNRTFYALSLRDDGTPVETLHSDLAFALVFQRNLSRSTLEAALDLLAPFPLGLATNVGVLCANPALDGNRTNVETFSREAYHGTVMWAFNSAFFALGLARVEAVCNATNTSPLSMTNTTSTPGNDTTSDDQVLLKARMLRPEWCSDTALLARLRTASRTLWTSINSAPAERYTEVHSWTYVPANSSTTNSTTSSNATSSTTSSTSDATSRLEVTPLSAFAGATEADAVQLWSYGFLGLDEPFFGDEDAEGQGQGQGAGGSSSTTTPLPTPTAPTAPTDGAPGPGPGPGPTLPTLTALPA